MSSVTVKIPTPLRPIIGGQAELKIDGATVGEVLRKIDSQHTKCLASTSISASCRATRTLPKPRQTTIQTSSSTRRRWSPGLRALAMVTVNYPAAGQDGLALNARGSAMSGFL